MKIISVRRTDIKRARAPRELWGSPAEWHNSLIGSLNPSTAKCADRMDTMAHRAEWRRITPAEMRLAIPEAITKIKKTGDFLVFEGVGVKGWDSITHPDIRRDYERQKHC